MRARIIDGITVAAAVGALVVLGFSASDRFRTTGRADAVAVANWESYAEHGRVLGNPDAPHTLVVFGDYECSACARLEPHLRALIDKHSLDLRIVYRHWPLRTHRYAYAAARAAECAATQGRFPEMHRRLFDEDWSLEPKVAFREMAESAGVASVSDFEVCLASRERVARIESDIAAAKSLGAGGTPTILARGHKYEAVLDSIALENVVFGTTRR